MRAIDLLPVLKAQHAAIDELMARLIKLDPKFLPTKSGAPWSAIIDRYHAIKTLEREAEQ